LLRCYNIKWLGYSKARDNIGIAKIHTRENESQKLTKVIVKIGVLYGVEPDLLRTAFDTFKEKTVCDGAEFIINHQKVVIKCLSCDTESTLEKNEFACPSCQSNKIKVTDGEDMY
jgi:hydrogenase nickel incorporation protein HypA/HybF